MSDEKYDLVCSGALVRGASMDQATTNLAKLFQVDVARAHRILSGKRVVLKRNLNFDHAMKYRAAIKKAGVLVDLVPLTDAEPTQLSDRVHSSPNETSQSDETSTPSETKAPQRAVNAKSSAPVATDSMPLAEMSLAEVGADVLTPAQRSAHVEREVDTSSLSLRQMGTNLVDESESASPPVAALDTPDFDLAQLGADVLRPDERRQDEIVDIDVSELSVAEVGARIGVESKESVPMPDVSHIQLSDG